MTINERHPLLVEMDEVGPKCNWSRHDGKYTKDDMRMQKKFLDLGHKYYNDLTIPGSREEKAEHILATKI